MVYQISKVCPELMYKQHTHMVYDELHIYPCQVLDQNANDNAYPHCKARSEERRVDGISDNMASLVKSGKYGAINTTYTSTNGFYVIMFTSGAYTLQENTTIDGQILIDG